MADEKEFPKEAGDGYHASELNTLQIVNVEAGENLTAGNVVYIKKNDGKVYKSDTGTADDIRADGIVIDTATSGNTADVQIGGNYVTSGLTAAEVYYLGATGAVSTTKSSVEIGVATSTTNLYINIVQDDADSVGVVKAYLKDFTGIPSNNLTAFWAECTWGVSPLDGSGVLTDAESPLNGQTIPDLNNSASAADSSRFLRGRTTSGGTGGADATTNTRGDTTGGTNAAAAHDNRPPFYDVVWIMKIK